MNPENQPPAPSSEPVETIRKVFVKDLREKQPLHTVFRAGAKNRITARSGKVFLALSLVDKTGEVDARVFDQVEAADQAFQPGDYLLVRGEVINFHGKPQVVIQSLEKLDPEPIDAREFTPPPQPATIAPSASASPGAPEKGGRPVAQIRELVERVQDPHVRALLLAFLDDPEIARGLPRAPAAKGIHHAYAGGLADHILSVMRLAHRMADHYPVADRDLLVAGALLHDIGKVQELSYEGDAFDYTDEGRLVGHLVMTAQKIREKALRIDGFPPLLEQHLTHLVLAHHGQLDYGSPKVPMTIEAQIVHAIDSLDSRIASWLEQMAKEPNDTWTSPNRIVDRHLWKGPSPTARGKAPVPPRKPRKDKKPRPERSERPEKPAEKREETPKLAFKPLDQLIPQQGSESPAAPAEPKPEAS